MSDRPNDDSAPPGGSTGTSGSGAGGDDTDGSVWSYSYTTYSSVNDPANHLSPTEALPDAIGVAVAAPPSESEGEYATDEDERVAHSDRDDGEDDGKPPAVIVVTKNQNQNNTATILKKRKRNRSRHAARSRKRAAKREAAGHKTVAAAAADGTEPTYRPVGGSDLFLRLVRKPPVVVDMVSIDLLKTAFPAGCIANWPKVGGGDETVLSRRLKKGKGLTLPLTEIPGWLGNFNRANQRVDIRELDDLTEVIRYTSSRIGCFTSFVLKAVINRQKKFKESSVWIPTARKGDGNLDVDDHKYTTYVVVIPQAGVFLTDYAVVLNGRNHSLVPLPLSWLGIYDERSVPMKSFVKKVLPGPQTIFKIVWTPGKLKAVARNVKASVKAVPIGAFQLNDRDPRTPLIPPNDFYDHNPKTGRVGTYNHAEGLNTEERREMYRSQFRDSSTNYIHCRRYVGASRHTKTREDEGVLLDYDKIGPFDIRIECKGPDKVTTHVSYIRVRKAGKDVIDSIRSVGRLVGRKEATTRRLAGDGGKMFATGSRYQLVREGVCLRYTLTDKDGGLLDKVQQLNTVALSYLRQEFNELISAFHLLEHASRKNKTIGESALTKTKNKDSYIVPSMNFTVNLWNADHYDVFDGSYGVGMWASDFNDPIENFEFILPNVVVSSGIDGVENVTVDGSGSVDKEDGTEVPLRGTRIKLFYGCVLSWSGTEIRHGTARIADKSQARQNRTYSAHWCSSVKQHTLAVSLAKLKKTKETEGKIGKDDGEEK